MTAGIGLVARIRERGLPEAVAHIAVKGGGAVSPALIYRAEAVWPETAEAVMSATDEELVPLWSCGTTHAFAGQGGFVYAAASWEEIDWSGMDVVGVNLYRMGNDPDAYERRVRSSVRNTDKSVVITELGCGSHVGADLRGPGSFLIVNWFRSPPRIRRGHVRDESVQAAYLADLIDLYAEAGAHGCFVYTFAMPDFPYDRDPRSDLDMAGFAVVRASGNPGERWVRKQAFSAVAERYSVLAH